MAGEPETQNEAAWGKNTSIAIYSKILYYKPHCNKENHGFLV